MFEKTLERYLLLWPACYAQNREKKCRKETIALSILLSISDANVYAITFLN